MKITFQWISHFTSFKFRWIKHCGIHNVKIFKQIDRCNWFEKKKINKNRHGVEKPIPFESSQKWSAKKKLKIDRNLAHVHDLSVFKDQKWFVLEFNFTMVWFYFFMVHICECLSQTHTQTSITTDFSQFNLKIDFE